MVSKKAPMADVAANYETIVKRIGEAALKSGRDPSEVKLLAAAKSQDLELIHAAIRAGIKLIGENYVQEARRKKLQISAPIEWHMIGHLQRNKAKAAAEIFDLIESLDSIGLATELNRVGKERGKKIRVFVELNLADEEPKSGIAKDKVVDLLKAASELSHVSVEGLMAVPPFRENTEDVRPYFRELNELRAGLRELKIPNVDLRELSMGMTHDYPIAIEEGATIVRIGTALFGPRKARVR
jgi:pyridoxal phosphate enzyme (YggS family)